MKRLNVLVGISLLVSLVTACREQTQFRKETFPVTGQVLVDGQPAAQLQVLCHNVAGLDAEHPTFSQAVTNAEGKFKIATYEQADGVPEGEYVLTFAWQEFNALQVGYSGPDKLKGKYSNPKTSQFRFKVEKGKPVDLGTIELSAQ